MPAPPPARVRLSATATGPTSACSNTSVAESEAEKVNHDARDYATAYDKSTRFECCAVCGVDESVGLMVLVEHDKHSKQLTMLKEHFLQRVASEREMALTSSTNALYVEQFAAELHNGCLTDCPYWCNSCTIHLSLPFVSLHIQYCSYKQNQLLHRSRQEPRVQPYPLNRIKTNQTQPNPRKSERSRHPPN